MPSYSSHHVPVIKNRRGPIPEKQRYRSLELIELSHEPEDILDMVKRLTMQPDHFQRYYKRKFVETYQDWIGMKTPTDYGQLKELIDDLTFAVEALDAFFFAGSLTRPYPYSCHGARLTNLQIQDNVFSEGKPGHQVYLDIGLPVLLGATSPRGGGWTTIFIDTLRNGSPRTVKSIFETLVHEMAHAIFDSFACGGADCTNEATNPWMLGRHGHGDMWVEMAEHMRNTIQTWDDDLADFYNTDDIRWHNKERN